MSDAATASQGGPHANGLLRALVVDDTPDIRFLLRLTLERSGRFEVVGEAGDGREAIEVATRLRPDVVLLDLAMPNMDGLEALPRLCLQIPDSKIVVLSGFSAREMSAEAMHLGASSYLEKGGIAERLVPHILQLFPGDEHHRGPLVGGPVSADVRAASGTGSLRQAPSEEWVAVLAHELTNPVTVLQGFAQVLESAADSMSTETIKRSAAAIGRAADHLGALVEAFSDLRKIEVDALDLVLESTNVSELVREIVTDMTAVTTTHPIIVEIADGVIASVDPPRIRQVLINLLANAAKFAPAATRIDLKVAIGGGNVEISVCDHGPGIPADRQSALFGKFARLNPEVPGTGIGLYLSRGIARAHGGDLVLAGSSAPGCCFVLQLPLLRAVDTPGYQQMSGA